VAPAQVEDSFMAGVLHDAGKLVLVANMPDRYREILTLAHNNGCTVNEAERQVLGATHAEVGGYLLALWGLPQAIVEAISFHHEPGRQQARELNCLTAVHVANDLVHSAGEPETESRLDAAYLHELQLANRLSLWQAACQKATREEEDAL